MVSLVDEADDLECIVAEFNKAVIDTEREPRQTTSEDEVLGYPRCS